MLLTLPNASLIGTVHAVLDRHGLVKRRKRRRYRAQGTIEAETPQRPLVRSARAMPASTTTSRNPPTTGSCSRCSRKPGVLRERFRRSTDGVALGLHVPLSGALSAMLHVGQQRQTHWGRMLLWKKGKKNDLLVGNTSHLRMGGSPFRHQ